MVLPVGQKGLFAVFVKRLLKVFPNCIQFFYLKYNSHFCISNKQWKNPFKYILQFLTFAYSLI